MNLLHFECNLPPSNNAYLKYCVAYAPSPTVRSYPSPESNQFKSYMKKVVARAVEKYKWEKPEPNIYINVIATMFLPRTNCDSNNYWKVLLDAITETGLVWYDDNIVLEKTNRIYYDSKNPRIVLTIGVSPIIGIFNDEQHLKSFKESNCEHCKKSRCSLMTQILSNKWSNEIDLVNNKCLKIKK